MKKKLLPTRILYESRKSKKNKRVRTFFIRQHMKRKTKFNLNLEETVLDMISNGNVPQISSSNEDNEMNAENERGFVTELRLFMN